MHVVGFIMRTDIGKCMYSSRIGYCCGRIYLRGDLVGPDTLLSCKNVPSTVEAQLCKQRYSSHPNTSMSHAAIARYDSELQVTPVTVADCTSCRTVC